MVKNLISYLMNKLILIALLIIFPIVIYSQNIFGKVTDINGNGLAQVSLVIKDSTQNTVGYALSKTDGNYHIFLSNESIKLLLIARKLGFSEVMVNIEKNTFQYDIVLDKLNEIKEVIVTGKQPNIAVKKDTTFYKIEKFTDGTERKVEDILKKLPGITVNEQGKIQFKGKEIEKVLLDGDDFFERNYTVGTKNISAKMIQEVQAIERYNENQILKKLENSDKIALNLKLKKGENDWNTNFTLGLGYRDKYLYDSNIMRMTYGLKNILMSSFNTIGLNTSLFDTYTNENLSNHHNKDFMLSNSLQLPFQNFEINSDYLYRNNSGTHALHNLLKLTDKSSLKLNLMFIHDLLRLNNAQEDTFISDSENFYYHQTNSITRQPIIYNGLINYLFSDSKWRWDVQLNINQNQQKQSLTSIRNTISDKVELTSNHQLEYFKSSFSHKLNDKSALEWLAQISDFTLFEKMKLEFSKIIEDNSIAEQNLQKRKIQYKNQFNVLFKPNNTKFKLGIFHQYNQEKLTSSLGNSNVCYFENNVQKKEHNIGLQSKWSWNSEKLFISNENEIFWLLSNIAQNRLIFNPTWNMVFEKSNKSKWELNYKPLTNQLGIDQLYQNYILTSPTEITHFQTDKTLTQTHFTSLNYTYTNFYKEYLVKIYSQFFYTNQNFNNNFNIVNDLYVNDNTLTNQPNNTVSLGFNYNKLFTSFKIRIICNSLYSHTNFKSNLFGIEQNNSIHHTSNSLTITTFFNSDFNFSNEIKLVNKIYNGVKNSEIQNQFTLLYSPNKKNIFKLNTLLQLPDSKTFSNQFAIANLAYYYTHNNKTLSVILNNIFNIDKIENLQPNENGFQYFYQNVQPIGITVKYDFW